MKKYKMNHYKNVLSSFAVIISSKCNNYYTFFSTLTPSLIWVLSEIIPRYFLYVIPHQDHMFH